MKTKWVNKLGGFPQDTRFKYDRIEKKLAEQSPGPTTAVVD